MAATKAKKVQVRLLVDTRIDEKPYRAGLPIELDARTAKGLVGGNQADDDPEAVAYALTQHELVVHGVEPAAEEDQSDDNPPQ